jgi:hypothetical protein
LTNYKNNTYENVLTSSDITTLSGLVNTHTSNITTLSGLINTNTNSITTLSGLVNTHTTNITTLSGLINTHTTNITTNTDSITTISGLVNTNTANITSNTTNITSNTANITSNTNSITALTSSLTNYALKAVANTFSALQTFSSGLTSTGVITANGGLTVPNGQTSSVDSITATGLITANGGITIPSGKTLTANGGLTVASGQTLTCSGAINCTGTSSFGDVTGNFIPNIPAVISITNNGTSGAPIVIPMQSAMIVYIYSNLAVSFPSHLQLTVNPNRVGQSFKFFNASANGTNLYVGTSNYIMGGGNTWTLNTIGPVTGSTKGTYSVTYIGLFYLGTHSFLFSTGF